MNEYNQAKLGVTEELAGVPLSFDFIPKVLKKAGYVRAHFTAVEPRKTPIPTLIGTLPFSANLQKPRASRMRRAGEPSSGQVVSRILVHGFRHTQSYRRHAPKKHTMLLSRQAGSHTQGANGDVCAGTLVSLTTTMFPSAAALRLASDTCWAHRRTTTVHLRFPTLAVCPSRTCIDSDQRIVERSPCRYMC